MTIYYSLTFLLLAAEMVTFCVVVAPLPYAVRKRLFRFLSESAIVAKIAYALKISFISVAILFADALQRMFRITAESDMAKQSGHASDVRSETNFAARKFYAQRNTYLTGFCLFLSLILTRTFYIVLDLIHTQDEYAKLKQQVSGESRDKIAANGDQTKLIEELKTKLAATQAKERDYDILKKQANQQAAEYDRLATEHNAAIGAKSDKRVD
ncbi:B-cell receptor-associated 31-like protein [Rickenella mellea]|uniref:Endoplasmic reticulum transmembrane protein n=1 Tax=Rickenella mellea TaxID=50990 RepID=A0A4Y7QHT6_9AGAM|nr:B-cell receptor-associated 31-like protein [Rickenella mellea]